MYRGIILGLLIAASPSMASAQGIAARNKAETLRGLNGVHVIVEEIGEVGAEAGVGSASIKSAVEARLKSLGVPVLGLGALAMDPRGPSLLVKVDMGKSDPVYFYNAQVQFFQNVNLMTGANELTSSASASTWQANKFDVIGKFRINTLPQEINRLVDAFANDYLKENGGAGSGGGEGDEMQPNDSPDGDEGQEASPVDSLSNS